MGNQNCVRIFLIGINVLFLLAGLAILGLGIWVQVEKGDYVALADSDTGLTGAILLIVVGAVAFLIAFAGMIGAIKRNRVLLWIFFSIVVLLFIVQVVALILGFIYQDKIEDELHDDMKKTIHEYEVSGVEGITKAWNWAQQKFECCGVDDYKDWRLSTTEFNKGGFHNVVPDSCCKVEAKGCGNHSASGVVDDVDKTKVYTKGCHAEVKDYIKDHLLVIGLAALVFVLIQLVIIVLTILLAVSIKE